jgi:hypothetical protein
MINAPANVFTPSIDDEIPVRVFHIRGMEVTEGIYKASIQ